MQRQKISPEEKKERRKLNKIRKALKNARALKDKEKVNSLKEERNKLFL